MRQKTMTTTHTGINRGGKMKTSLVLEGGGMRGAYTAGCLAWLLDNDISFDTAFGISTGAVHLCSFLCGSTDYLYTLSTEYIADKLLVGIKPLLKEGQIVGYGYLFEHILPMIKKYDIERAKASKTNAYFGVYDIDEGTKYIDFKDLDPNMELLKASCTLPVIGKAVEYKDKKYLDGGITKMIPIEAAIDKGADNYLVITTKPKDFVRKPATALEKVLMRLLYLRHPNISRDYAVRHLNYQKQLDIINDLVAKDKAVYIYPSQTIAVSRMSGDKADLKKLYDLGYKDMEANREVLLAKFSRK